MDRAKRIWEELGENDAYFAVATCDEFKRGNLDDLSKERFFQSGRDHVEELWAEFERGFGPVRRPKRGLDYGCGVGRILVALAEKCDTVVGVDISNTMLVEAKKNCQKMGLTNVELQSTEEFTAADSDKFDLIHSYIVLQHVKPAIGYKIIRSLIDKLDTDGLGAIHITFFDPSKGFTRFRNRVYRNVPFVHRLVSRLRGKNSQFMPMYEYRIDHVFRILKESGCHKSIARFTDHGSFGATLLFCKGGAKLCEV
jgi:ubiquinone/menaquinone biosynthesis C-methylase UbiE